MSEAPMLDKIIRESIDKAVREAIDAVTGQYGRTVADEEARKVAESIAKTPEFRAKVEAAMLAALAARSERR